MSDMGIEETENRSLQGEPDSGGVEDPEGLRDRCRTDRSGMTPKETADCTGAEISDVYDSEEDGGS